MAHRAEHWRQLLAADADVALLQEAGEPLKEIAAVVDCGPQAWKTGGKGRPWRACVAGLNPAAHMTRFAPHPAEDAENGTFAVSRSGTVDAASVADPNTGESFTLVSMYAQWERQLNSLSSSWIYADAAAHRLISDLSVFIGHQRRHRIIAAGDLNLFHGYGDRGSSYWAARYQTVFDRMAALGLRFVGPQRTGSDGASLNVPTFRKRKGKPESATDQLDFVFASEEIAERVRVTAVDTPEAWGPSDHCMVRIDVR